MDLTNEFRGGIQIRRGECYKNRTRRYLSPSLRDYGKALWTKLYDFYILAWGLSDFDYEIKKGRCFTEHLFILIDPEAPSFDFFVPFPFQKFLDWLSNKEYFVDFYQYKDTDYVMLVLERPELFKEKTNLFLNSEYAKIYQGLDIEFYLPRTLSIDNVEYFNPTYGVVTESSEQKTIFTKLLEERFDILLKEEEVVGYDYPVFPNQEIFNYNEYHYDNIFRECLYGPRS